jgi:hypothetical protein
MKIIISIVVFLIIIFNCGCGVTPKLYAPDNKISIGKLNDSIFQIVESILFKDSSFNIADTVKIRY